MKKKLAILAAIGASTMQLAAAQSANPVTIYARAYVMFESSKAAGGGPGSVDVSPRNKVTDYSSYLGFRGEEDLGGGLRATFQMETGFRMEQTATFAARNSKVGLEGSFGEIFLGRWDSPFKRATVAIDPFSNLTAGDLTAVVSDRGNFNRRDQNVVQWWSPNWSNFVVKVAHVVNEGRTPTTNPSGLSASAVYSVKENFSLGYAWEQHKDQFKSYSGALTNVAGGRETGHALVGHAMFGPLKVAAQIHRFKKSTGTAATVTDIKAYQVAFTYYVGSHEFIYTYLKSADGLAPTAALQPQSTMNVIGYFYRLSKRSTLVAQYLQLNNNAVGLSDAGQAITAGQDPRVLSIGMRHTF